MKRLSLMLGILAILGLVLAGCGGGAPAEEPAAEEPAPAAAEPAAEEPMAEEPMGNFTGQVQQWNTIADYEADTGNTIDSFQQSPVLDAMVADGSLPPIEERLPDEPLVMQPADRIGDYGGTMRNVHEGNFDFLEDLLREFPHVYGSNMQGVLPNVFMHAETSPDGTTTTFTIRPGIKWSDGEPFGADDFVFWYEAIAANTDLSPSGVNNMKVGGEMGKVVKVDDNTIEMQFVAPYGVLHERLNRWRPMPYVPAHYLAQFHPDYTDPDTVNATAEEKGYASWVELFEGENYWYGNPDLPTIFAWQATTRGASVPVQELVRNPYYWKIDTAGNQLPYVDAINRPNLGDREAILLDVLSGANDYMNPYTLGYLTNYPVLKQNEASGGYRVLPQFGWSDVLGVITFNMSSPDETLRELFNNKDFRVALSIAYDREEINQVVFNGLYKPSQVAPPDGSVYNGADPAFKLHTEHDPERANEILDQLGFTWNDDNTQRMMPDGRPFELSVQVNTGWVQQVPIAELIAQGWEDIGFKTTIVPLDPTLHSELDRGIRTKIRWLMGGGEGMAGPVHWRYTPPSSPRRVTMLRTSSLYPLSRELKRRLPSVRGRLRRDLALWVKGTILAHNGCLDSTAAAVEMHGRFETLRRELREWTCDDADRPVSWGPGTEVDAAACFPELLGWVLDLWTPGEGDPATEPSLILALDPTHQRDEWVALAVSVVYRGQALPVAWHVVRADAPESWIEHYRRLLLLLAPAVPAGMPVHVLCDRGLGSRKLWARITGLGWHPVLRYGPQITFRPTGGARVPVRSLDGGPGTFWVGAGAAFADKPLPCTLIVLHAEGHEEPWVLLTDTPPKHTGASLYACRHWIEQGFRGLKRGGWQWGRTRRTDPVRVARHLLALAVATLLAVAYGTRCEQARARGRPPGRPRRPPTRAPSKPGTPRRFSVLRQGAACLQRLLVRNRLWARVWLTPVPGPDRTAGLRCLSPPAA